MKDTRNDGDVKNSKNDMGTSHTMNEWNTQNRTEIK